MKTELKDFDFIDIHYHANPDLYHRRHHVLFAGREYLRHRGVVVLRSHLGATSIQASIAQQNDLPVLPSLILNAIAGGIHYRVIMQALAEFMPRFLSAKLIVDFPTITGRQYQSKLNRELVYPSMTKALLKPETIFDAKNRLRKEVIDIVKMANDYPIVLSTGHASKEEIFSLVELADKYQLKALLINQPAHPLTKLSFEELKELSHYSFVNIEQTALTYLIGHQTKEEVSKIINEIPQLIYSSDLGQTNQIDISQYLSFSKNLFDELQLSPGRQKELCLNNILNFLTL